MESLNKPATSRR